jgi:hypothetical protein
MSKLLARVVPALAVVGLGALASSANAATLNLIKTNPDVFSDMVVINYTASSGKFTAMGVAESITPGGSISAGSFSLTAFLSSTGTPVSNAATLLTITGNSGTTFYSSTHLSAFGFSTLSDASTQLFEFVFSPGTIPGGLPGSIGVKLNGQVTAGYSTNLFTKDFASVAFGNADTFPVPLPSAALMGLSTMAFVPIVLRRKKA